MEMLKIHGIGAINDNKGKVMRKCLNVLTICLLAACVPMGASYAKLSPHAVAASSKEKNKLPLEDVQRFSTTISHIKNFYVEPVDDKDLFEDAIRGMLKGLDPHSAYLDKDEFNDLKVSTNGEYGGLGIEISQEDGYVKVVSPIDDTPAAKAGIEAGDLIVKVDNKPIKGMSLKQAVKLMRGKAGAPIKLTVIRKKTKKPLVFNLKREIIQIRTVKAKLYDKKYGYVRISHFQSPTAGLLEKEVMKLRHKAGGKLSGLVLDLRNNPGGLLDSAIKISDFFVHDSKLNNKLLVYTKGRAPGSEYQAHATAGDIIKGAPIVILINEGSASGSEIVAGALQDHKRAVVIGTKSFGKGSVQTVLPLDEHHGMKLTTARYYTPKGRSIQAHGITPDIVVESMKVADVDNEVDKELSLKEADLQGHLAHESKKDEGIMNSAEDKKLAKSDYQLYQALNILKGLAILQANNS